MAQNIINHNGYGYLYNWYAASNSKIAPSGWHIPSNSEFISLSSYLGGDSISGLHLKEAGYTHWIKPTSPLSGDNSSGFNGYGGGVAGLVFNGLGQNGYFWSTTDQMYGNAYSMTVQNTTNLCNPSFPDYYNLGFSLRLLKNDSINPGTVTDYDGNVYNCVTIGTQVWINKNFICIHLNDGTIIPNVTDRTAWDSLTTLAWCVFNNDYSYK